MPEKKEFVNPIDKDKTTETPGLLPYPHAIGSPAFAPTKMGMVKKNSLSAMDEQCNMQLNQIKEQIELLARQAEKIEKRREVSKAVYSAKMSFEPIIGKEYHLYAKGEGNFVLSMVAPDEWGRSTPFTHYVSSVVLLSDRTWDVVKEP